MIEFVMGITAPYLLNYYHFVTTDLIPRHFHRYKSRQYYFLPFLPLKYFNCIFFSVFSLNLALILSFFVIIPSASPPMHIKPYVKNIPV